MEHKPKIEVGALLSLAAGAPPLPTTGAEHLQQQQQQQKNIKKCALKPNDKNRNSNFCIKITQNSDKSLKSRPTTTTTMTTTTTSKRATTPAKTTIITQQTTARVSLRPSRAKKFKHSGAQPQLQIQNQAQTRQQTQTQNIQTEQINPTTKENFLLTLDLLAVVRRNASDKLKLIQMVHDNPILWDSRLPNFKGAEEEKNRAWEHIGREFSAPGRRVARAFKSLRESYRRELAHVKLMGSGFKPKWSLYESMDFLRDVIRERKGGSHAADLTSSALAGGLNLSAYAQHLSNTNNSSNNNNSSKSSNKNNSLHSSFNDSALNLSKCSSLSMSQDDYYYCFKPEMDLSNGGGAAGVVGGGVVSGAPPLQPLPAHQTSQFQQQQQQQLQNDSRVTSTRHIDTTTPQNTAFSDIDAVSDEASAASAASAQLSHHGSEEIEELDAIDADFPYPLILDSANAAAARGAGIKRRRSSGEDDDDDDDYEGQMLQQHRHLRQQNGYGLGGGGGGGGGIGNGLDMPPPQTVREVLNSKFCGFISAKLNSMDDTEADSLMNRILMLLVQTQTQDGSGGNK